MNPPGPRHEAARLAALHALHLLDTPSEERFDRYTRIARRLLDAPIALVSLVDHGRQWFKSRLGLALAETSREISFCGHALFDPNPLVVPDARADSRFADNPLVRGPPHIRAYAGVPLIVASCPSAVGTLCVIDVKPRRFDSDQVAILTDVASLVVDELQVHADAVTDPLTGLLNRRGFAAAVGPILAQCARAGRGAVMLYIDLDDFKQINDTLGHRSGDRAIAEMGHQLRACFRSGDVAARLGGDEFAVLCPETSEAAVQGMIRRLRRSMGNIEERSGVPVRFSAGSAAFDPARHTRWDVLVDDADAAMFSHKRFRKSVQERVRAVGGV